MKKDNSGQLPELKKTGLTKTLSLFSISTLLVGMMVSWLSYLIFPVHPYYNTPNFMPPGWFLAVVWCILYPCMGLSAGYIWLLRTAYDVRSAMAFYIAMLFTNLLFLPVSNLSGNNPGIMTLMDMNGVVYAIIFSGICYGYSRKAFLWSLPLLLWMPVTAFLKILLWMVVTI